MESVAYSSHSFPSIFMEAHTDIEGMPSYTFHGSYKVMLRSSSGRLGPVLCHLLIMSIKNCFRKIPTCNPRCFLVERASTTTRFTLRASLGSMFLCLTDVSKTWNPTILIKTRWSRFFSFLWRALVSSWMVIESWSAGRGQKTYYFISIIASLRNVNGSKGKLKGQFFIAISLPWGSSSAVLGRVIFLKYACTSWEPRGI